MMTRAMLTMIAKMTLAICFIICLLSAVAIPKYLSLNKQNEANQCRANQIMVETALVCAYAESLAVGRDQFPQKLIPAMFEGGKIPTCPVDGKSIAVDHRTGHAFCPNHIEAHSRSF